jgi:hypothetical protein
MSQIRAIIVGFGVLGAVAGAAQAQQTLTFKPDSKSSLAWWQINPHMDHLWSTTCPQEPSWRPGEGRGGGWTITQAFKPPKHGSAGVNDTTIIPLYPRRRVRSVCTEALTGEVRIADTVSFRGVSGWINVKAAALNQGESLRDEYTNKNVTEVNTYPDIKFTVDSLTQITRVRDTVRAVAQGSFTFRGVTQPMHAAVRAWHEPTGTRVLAKFKFKPMDLIKVYGVSGFVLGMGVGSRIWYDVYGGVDMVLVPTTSVNSTH